MVVAVLVLGCGGTDGPADGGTKYDPFAAIECWRHFNGVNGVEPQPRGVLFLDIPECKPVPARVAKCCADAPKYGVTSEVCAMTVAAGVGNDCNIVTPVEIAMKCANGDYGRGFPSGLYCPPPPP